MLSIISHISIAFHISECRIDALRYLGKPTKEAGNILRYADKYNKNGKRAKTFGYSWVKL